MDVWDEGLWDVAIWDGPLPGSLPATLSQRVYRQRVLRRKRKKLMPTLLDMWVKLHREDLEVLLAYLDAKTAEETI